MLEYTRYPRGSDTDKTLGYFMLAGACSQGVRPTNFPRHPRGSPLGHTPERASGTVGVPEGGSSYLTQTLLPSFVKKGDDHALKHLSLEVKWKNKYVCALPVLLHQMVERSGMAKLMISLGLIARDVGSGLVL